jgi:formate-dependent nitrite reductase membrane component NrfD
MLRLYQPYSVMSLGSWVLAGFGAATGAAATLQVIEDRAAPGPRLARLSHSKAGPLLHLIGLPNALLLGSYTGILLASTSTPAWAKRRLTLPPLFLASGAASGLTATAAIVEARSSARSAPVSVGARRRLARASVAALAAELVLSLADQAAGAGLPSLQATPRRVRTARELSLLAGTIAPLVLTSIQARRLAADSASKSARATPSGRGKVGILLASLLKRTQPKKERHTSLPLLAAILALGGGLALRFRITEEGYHSADTAADTWELARERG